MNSLLPRLFRLGLISLLLSFSFLSNAAEADFIGTSVTVDGDLTCMPILDGVYDYKYMLNDKPIYASQISYEGMDLTVYLKWITAESTFGESAWVFSYSSNYGDAYIANNIQQTDSVPMNGWTVGSNTDDAAVTFILSGCVENNIIVDPYFGQTLGVSGTDIYNGVYTYAGKENGMPFFTDTLENSSVAKISYSYPWTLSVDNVVKYTNAYESNKLVPEHRWVDVNAEEGTRGNIVEIANKEAITFNPYYDLYIDVEGSIGAVNGYYSFNEVVDGYPVYMNDKSSIQFINGKWSIIYSSTILHITDKYDGDLVPQNGWSESNGNIPSLTGNATVLLATGSTLNIVGSDVDGEYICTYFDGYTFIYTKSDDDNVTISMDNEWEIKEGDQVKYVNAYYPYVGDALYVPENAWTTIDGEHVSISVEGEYTHDVFTDNSLFVASAGEFDGMYSYSEMNDGFPVFVNGDYSVALVHGLWSLLDGETSVYTSSKVSFLVPSNGWTSNDGEAGPVLSSYDNVVVFVYEGEVIELSGFGDADASYTYTGKNDYNFPTFSSIPTSGFFNGTELTVNCNDYPSYWYVSATINGVDTVIATNTAVPSDDYNNYFIPQNMWMLNDVFTPSATVVGSSTKYVNGVHVSDSEIGLNAVFVDAYNYGYYSAEIDYFYYSIELDYRGSEPVWTMGYYGNEGEVIVAQNPNLNDILLPQNRWVVDGEVSSTMIIAGDSTFFVSDPSSIDDKEVKTLTVYPNPAKDVISISVENATMLDVYSVSGVHVLSQSLNSGVNDVSLDALAKGIYLFVSEDDTNRYVSRVVIE